MGLNAHARLVPRLVLRNFNIEISVKKLDDFTGIENYVDGTKMGGNLNKTTPTPPLSNSDNGVSIVAISRDKVHHFMHLVPRFENYSWRE